MTENKEKQINDEDKNYVNQHGNWILGLHYDREAKAYRRYDLDNKTKELKYTDILYDKNGNIIK